MFGQLLFHTHFSGFFLTHLLMKSPKIPFCGHPVFLSSIFLPDLSHNFPDRCPSEDGTYFHSKVAKLT